MLRASMPMRVSSVKAIKLEKTHAANNYSPLAVVFSKANGAAVWNPEGKKYVDCLSGYGAVNQGHLHPKIVAAATTQLRRCTLSSRAFYNDRFGNFAKYITKTFGYEKVLPMNTGAEGVETALKLARRWGYTKKGIPTNCAQIVCCNGNFHGRTFGAITMSDDPDSYGFYGPLLPGIMRVDYGDAAALEAVFKKHHKTICGFICEPIQGEAGVIIPPAGYLRKVRQLCTKYNILYIDDEVQSGIGRTGKLLAVDHEGVRPDVVILAKALGGGILPVSAVLSDAKHMTFEPGTHGSTFGGNPLSAAVGLASLRALKSERMVQRAARSGRILDRTLRQLKNRFPFIKDTRCRGLFAAIEMDHGVLGGKSAKELMYLMKKQRVLCKVTHDHTIRITPPLVITKQELAVVANALAKSLVQLQAKINASKKVDGKKTSKPRRQRA